MSERRVTKLGTPCSSRWPEEWVRRVEEAEERLGRRVCGAATWDSGPCVMAAEHESGRCRYHGGHVRTGAPLGSSNARVHGLYSRRLQRCGPHCPLWESCAFSGDDVLALPAKQRPVCAYEREEYAALVKHYFKDDIEPKPEDHEEDRDENEEDDEDDFDTFSDKSECPEPFLLHQLVMLTIMQTRAAAVLSQVAFTDPVEVESPNYSMKTAKPGAALEAFLRIAREYRGLRAVIDTKKLVPQPQRMGIGSRLRPLMKRAAGAVEAAIAETERRKREQAEQERRASIAAFENDPTPMTGNTSQNENEELPDSSPTKLDDITRSGRHDRACENDPGTETEHTSQEIDLPAETTREDSGMRAGPAP